MAAEKHLLKGVYMSIRVLFVCHGNICRSPMSEFILKDMVEKRGIKDKFDIASAATSTEEIWNGKGNSIYPPAQAELKKHGIGKTAYTNFSSKRARQVTKQDYNYYDYLLCADSSNIRNTIRITGPDTDNKIKLLLDYTERKGSSIADPWYSGNFVDTYSDVVEGCEGFLAYLESQHII
jgi:protein-tyrosine phosphatase